MEGGSEKVHSDPSYFSAFLFSVESERAESAENTIKMLTELNELNLKTLGQKQKTLEDHLIQLTEQRDKDTASLMAEQGKIFDSKLQVINCDIFGFSFNGQE